MKRLAQIFAVTLALAPLLAVAKESEKASLACDIGPVQRHYGSNDWLVYSCADARSVVVVSATGTSSRLGYFLVSPHGQGVTVAGEGWGKDSAYQPAFQALKGLNAQGLAAMVMETKEVGAKPVKK